MKRSPEEMPLQEEVSHLQSKASGRIAGQGWYPHKLLVVEKSLFAEINFISDISLVKYNI
jgi:hypothetical protein